MLKTSASTTKILASVVLVAGAASVAGMGTFGAFTSTTTASENVSTEKVVLGKTADSLGVDVAIPALVPGDTVQRPVTLTRSADTASGFGSVKLTTSASTVNALTEATNQNGLKLTVEQCPVAWTVNADTKVMTCSTAPTSIITNRAVIGADTDLPAVKTALNAEAKTAYLKVTLSLPTAAGNEFQGLSNKITFDFTATQRDATAR